MVVRCWPLVVCRLSIVVCCLLYVVCCLLFVVCRFGVSGLLSVEVLFVACSVSFDRRVCSLCIVRCALLVDRCSLFVVCSLLLSRSSLAGVTVNK